MKNETLNNKRRKQLHKKRRLTDSEELELLQQDEYQKKVAEGIAKGIINYLTSL